MDNSNNSGEKRKFKIALDAMGGDFAPKNEIEGLIKLFKENVSKDECEVVLVGKQEIIEQELTKHNLDSVSYSIVNADEIVTMNDDPMVAIKSKKNSSLAIGLNLHKEGKVDAFVSAGHTGAMLATSTVMLGRIKGVSRPTIGSFLPTEKSAPTLLMDVGANVDCKARFLYEFAVMGSIYYKQMIGIENPTVGLLNIGEESSKGNEVVLQTYSLLKSSKLNFIGNLEGREIFKGNANVIVCDGFTGNIVLKFAESFLTFFKNTLKSYANQSTVKKVKVGLMAPTLKDMFKAYDYQQYGGVPLLGVNGVSIIGHGSSSPIALQNMLVTAINILKKDINGKIREALLENENKD